MEHDTALLSDLDGTLVDTTGAYYQALADICAARGIAFSMEIFQRNRQKTVLQWFLDQDIAPAMADELCVQYADHLNGLLESTQWLPGAPEFLTTLNDAKVPCALVTLARASSLVVMHRVLRLREFFRVIIDRETVGAKRKPDPYGIHEAMRLLGKQQGIMLGDEPVDAQAGNAAGLKTYHIPGPHTPEHDRALWTGGIIKEYRELLHVWGLQE